MVPDQDASLRPGLPPARPAVGLLHSNVAVVRSDNRRGAVAEALALLDAELRPILAGPSVILVHLEREKGQAAALSSLLDVVLSAEVGGVVVASGDANARARFDRSGMVAEGWGRAVRFLDLPRDEDRWREVERPGIGSIRIAGTWASAGCRVALTPVSSLNGRRGMPAGRRTLLAAIHPDDRPRSDGVPIRRCWPDLSIVEGPIGRFGREVVAIAGIDPTAVDAAAAAVLGRDRGRQPADDGSDAPAYRILGDPIVPAEVASGRTRFSFMRGLRHDPGHGQPGRGS